MSVTSSEFFVNLRKEDIPPWNDILPFEDQLQSTQDFWNNEAEKVLNGVTINGFYFHPLLYWYLNFWNIPKDIKNADGSIDRKVLRPDLRDNELYFIENYQEAQKKGLHLLMFGTRRFGKALLDTEIIYTKYGPKPIGLAMYGEQIYDESGNLTRIKGVYPQGYVNTYKITFEDGRKIVCCGDHLWKSKYGEIGLWGVRDTKSLYGKKDVRIPICSSINYPHKELDINPSFYASSLASYISGTGDNILLDDYKNSRYIMSSPDQRIEFLKSFIVSTVGIETGYDSFTIKVNDRKAIYFIKQMFWASGYFCKTEDDKFIFSKHKKDLKIISIEKGEKQKCTCIEVSNDSRLFLTTNHIVTHNTAIISNYVGYHASVKYNSTNSVVGGSAKDLNEIAKYMELGLDHIHPFFRFSRIGNDWSKGVMFGAKDKNNTRLIYSYIDILNADMGKASSTQKPAGATPSSAVFDEVGKFNFLGPYLAALPSFSTPYGSRLTAILAGTSGEIEKCEDVQKVMNDPLAYRILPMNWDFLDKRAGDHITWKRRSWGMFVPGQMSHSEYTPKIKMGLDKYLDIKNGRQLSKIKILATDWEKSKNNLNKEIKRLEKGDKKNYANFKMYYPRDPEDCFSNINVNRYPVDLAVIRKRELEEKGQVGILADVWLNDDKTLGWKSSDKQLASYPFQGGIVDAPVQIFEFPDKNYDFSDYVYSAGCLLPGEKVLTDKGLVNVEDVCSNHKLVNKDGEYVGINAFLKYNKVDEPVYEFKISNTYRTTTFTKEHPIYVSKARKVNSKIEESLFEFNFIDASNVEVNDWIKYPNLYTYEIDESKYMDGIESNNDIWWLAGFYIGNGYVDKNRKRVSFAANYNDTSTINNLIDICNKFGNSYHRVRRGTSFEITVKNDVLSEWLVNIFGRYAISKKISEWVKFIPLSKKISFIMGYLDSDGNIGSNGRLKNKILEFTSINLCMLEDLQDIIMSVGATGGITKMRGEKESFIIDRVSTTKSLYHLRISPYGTSKIKKLYDSLNLNRGFKINNINNLDIPIKRKGCFISDDNKYIYYQIKDISVKRYTGVVYNFDCETHTYLCHHITTHNCDPYKKDTSMNSSSLGSFYIFKRKVRLGDPYGNRIVCSYVARPSNMDQFCETCRALLWGYKCKCLMENADIMLETYLKRINEAEMLLAYGDDISGKLVKPGAYTSTGKYGLSTAGYNQSFLEGLGVRYTWQDMQDIQGPNGEVIETKKAIQLIDDPHLLSEYISYKPGRNVDRIVGFHHALALADYYDYMRFFPKSPEQKEEEKKKMEQLQKRYVRSTFVNVSRTFR